MKRVSGLVLVRETGLGIPNVVVAVFDSDLTIEDIRNQEMSAHLMLRAGRRIGSVLTDRDGRFSLPAEDLEFAGNEARPDLLLMVLAPEDVQDLKRPYPLPAEERTLYVSTVPRVDAGAEEAYVIRLLQAQVDRFRIPTGPAGRDTHTAVRELSDPIVRALDIRDGMRKMLGPRLEAERKETERARSVAKSKVERLSALPPHLRKESQRKDALLIVGKAKVAEDLPSLQAKSIADGIARMKDSPVQPTLRLRLTEQDIEDLHLKVEDGKISGRVPAAALSEKLRSMVNLLDLVRVRDSEPPSPDELERKYLTPPPAAPEPADEPIL